MAIRNPQTTLDLFYAARDAALVALANPQADVVSYTLDGRSVEIRTWADMAKLEELIRYYETVVAAASGPVVADFREAHSNA